MVSVCNYWNASGICRCRRGEATLNGSYAQAVSYQCGTKRGFGGDGGGGQCAAGIALLIVLSLIAVCENASSCEDCCMDHFSVGHWPIFVIVTVLAGVSILNWRTGRIPNWLTVSIAVAGLLIGL